MIIDSPLNVFGFLSAMAPRLVIGVIALALIALVLYLVIYHAVRHAVCDALGIRRRAENPPASGSETRAKTNSTGDGANRKRKDGRKNKRERAGCIPVKGKEANADGADSDPNQTDA